jgi:NTE family protein/lysophospholipid hydrolase
MTPSRTPTHDDLALLAATPLFGGLGKPLLEHLFSQLEPVRVPAGATLFAQGEPGDSLFVVVVGRLRVSVATPSGVKVVSELSRGDVVGEIALLSHRPRSATVRAVRDTEVWQLPGTVLLDLVERQPEVLRKVTDVVISRLLSRDLGEGPATGVRTVAVVPAGGLRQLDDFAEKLTSALARDGGAIRLTRQTVESAVGSGTADAALAGEEGSRVLHWLHQQEERHRHVVYQADPEPTPWTERCARQADLLLFVAEEQLGPALGPVETALLTGPAAVTQARRELVLLHRAGSTRPRGTARWLRHRAVVAHHHVAEGRTEDLDRVARLITGRGCGLVLGGGGARGFAHLGVIRALEETGIPMDVVGGASIGAMIGYGYCLGMSHAERVHAVEEVLVNQGALLPPTLPIVSLSAGKKLRRLLTDAAFGLDADIEDLWTRFFCVSTNLTRGRVEVHEHGEAYRAIRASASLPGILPPVWQNGDLLVDGAVMNNIPVDVMRERVGSGVVIAVDIHAERDLSVRHPFDTTLGGGAALLHRFRRSPRAVRVPGIMAILMRTVELGDRRALESQLAAAADLIVAPPVAGFGPLDFAAARVLVDRAYRHTLVELEAHPFADRIW